MDGARLRGLWIDAFSGMAGDMFLGALCDLGLDVGELARGLEGLGLEGYRVEAGTVHRGAIRATKFDVVIRLADGHEVREQRDDPHLLELARARREEVDGHGHGERVVREHGGVQGEGAVDCPGDGDVDVDGHADDVVHAHDEGKDGHAHAHGKTYREITALIANSSLSESVRVRALRIFGALAEAEARVHGVAIDDVHFHEVGAVDSIVDICGCALALEMLGVDEVVASPVGVGSGTAKMAHGTVPVPVPATAELIRGMPVVSTGVSDELLTPTGAAILRTVVDRFEPDFAWRSVAVGYGAGSTDRADPPNVVRVTAYERDASAEIKTTGDSPSRETVGVVETDIDDMTGEALGHARSVLESAPGVLDVSVTPIAMKKDRPGHHVRVVTRQETIDWVEAALFRHTSTFGIRHRVESRTVLERESVEVMTPLGAAQVKIGRRGGEILQVSPEYEDCARLARAADRSLDSVMALVVACWRESYRGKPGS